MSWETLRRLLPIRYKYWLPLWAGSTVKGVGDKDRYCLRMGKTSLTLDFKASKQFPGRLDMAVKLEEDKP